MSGQSLESCLSESTRRNLDIVLLRLEGVTFREIANVHNISRSRVCQIYEKILREISNPRELSVRAENCLRAMSIETKEKALSELHKNNKVFYGVPNLGDKTRKEIMYWLEIEVAGPL